MLDPRLSKIAVTGTVITITILAYGSQLFLLAPHLTTRQFYLLNTIVACIWITYYRAMFTPAGSPPKDYTPPSAASASDAESGHSHPSDRRMITSGATRFCKVCDAFKPARTHHCKTCKTCVLRMDHHCPWTYNCVGFCNTGHFIRFLVYATAGCGYVLCFLAARWWAVYQARQLPDYLSPHSLGQLVFLTLLTLVDGPLTLALFILMVRTLANYGEGYTTIETFEAERHAARVWKRQAKKQIFPYDIGIWENLCAAFGYSCNPIAWLNPLASTPRVGEKVEVSTGKGVMILAGLEFEVNGFEDPDHTWPPADPDKMGIVMPDGKKVSGFTLEGNMDVDAFRRRQKTDLKRWERTVEDASDESDSEEVEYPRQPWPAPSPWRNEDGETLADYGVDEELEDDDEDVPLAVLQARIKARR